MSGSDKALSEQTEVSGDPILTLSSAGSARENARLQLSSVTDEAGREITVKNGSI
ncbi:uncharacterized protein LOC143241031 isoform X3 [Tachypleus tridentatus]|uniref:uncharacterized protein LOC143241031 isoform X3 n=1 Tax=Tachypleus tridentatus TaxID=6853 RepID=UPI003FD1778A